MTDYIIKATVAKNQIRVYAATTKETVEHARVAHNTSPVATAALGRLLTAGAMMGSMMKDDKDLLTLKINCSGDIEGIIVTANSKAEVKGYVYNPNVMLPPTQDGKLDVGKALDLGVMSIIKDIGMKEPYVGQTHLVSGEIAEDLTYYYAASEQIPTSVGLGVLMEKNNTVKHAGGFIIQLMPFAEDKVIDILEEKLKKVKSVTSFFEEGCTVEGMLENIFEDFGDLQIHEKVPTGFYCNCSKEKVEKAVVSLGKDELQSIIQDEEPIEVNCHFCNTHYIYHIEELKAILARK